MSEEKKYKEEMDTYMKQMPQATQAPQVQQAPQMYQMPQMCTMPQMQIPCCPFLMSMQCPMMYGQDMMGGMWQGMGNPHMMYPYMHSQASMGSMQYPAGGMQYPMSGMQY